MGACSAKPKKPNLSKNEAIKEGRSRQVSVRQAIISQQHLEPQESPLDIRSDFLERYPNSISVPNTFYSVISSAKTPYDFQFAEYITRDDLRRHDQRIKMCQTMDHPGLLKLYDCYESSNGYFLVYEEAKGHKLNDLKGKLKDVQIRDFTYQLLKTFEFLHKKGLVHGGLDERSFIFNTQSWVKLFSYVIPQRIIQPKTDKPASISTYFKPPEVILGKEPTAAADVWGIAILIQYLILGKTMFEDKNEQLVQKRITNGNYLLGSSGLTDETRDFIDDILQIEPHKRPTATQLLKHKWFSVLKPPPLSQLSHLHRAPDTDEIDKTSLSYQLSKVYFDSMREKIFRIYQIMDVNNDGVLSKEELISSITKKYRGEPVHTLIQHLVQQIDKANKNFLTFGDFLEAIFDDTNIPDDSQVLKIFKFLEKDVGKKVQLNHIMECLHLMNVHIHQDVVSGAFSKSDKDRDGSLNYKEFCMFFDRGLDIRIFKVNKAKQDPNLKSKKQEASDSSEEDGQKPLPAKSQRNSKLNGSSIYDIDGDTNEILLKARQRRMVRVTRSEVSNPQTQSVISTSNKIPIQTNQTITLPKRPQNLIAPHQRLERHHDPPELQLQHAKTISTVEQTSTQFQAQSDKNSILIPEGNPIEEVESLNNSLVQQPAKKKHHHIKNGVTNHAFSMSDANKRYRNSMFND